MKYLLKLAISFGLSLTFALGSMNANSVASSNVSVEIQTETFASADDDSKKKKKRKTTKKKKKKKKSRFQARTING